MEAEEQVAEKPCIDGFVVGNGRKAVLAVEKGKG